MGSLRLLQSIDSAPAGVFLYVYNKARTTMQRGFEREILRSSRPPTQAPSSSEALRDFGLGAQVLADLGCKRIQLMTSSTRKIVGIEGFGMEVVKRVPIPAAAGEAPCLRAIPGGSSGDDS